MFARRLASITTLEFYYQEETRMFILKDNSCCSLLLSTPSFVQSQLNLRDKYAPRNLYLLSPSVDHLRTISCCMTHTGPTSAHFKTQEDTPIGIIRTVVGDDTMHAAPMMDSLACAGHLALSCNKRINSNREGHKAAGFSMIFSNDIKVPIHSCRKHLEKAQVLHLRG